MNIQTILYILLYYQPSLLHKLSNVYKGVMQYKLI